MSLREYLIKVIDTLIVVTVCAALLWFVVGVSQVDQALGQLDQAVERGSQPAPFARPGW